MCRVFSWNKNLKKLPVSLSNFHLQEKKNGGHYNHYAQLVANLIVFYQRGCRQDKEGLQRRIADSVVAPFNWCEITFFGGGASNRLTPEIIEFDTVDELRP